MQATILDPRGPGAAKGARAVLRRLLDRPSSFLVIVLMAQLMVVLDGTIVNVALPHIERGLHFSSAGLSWVLNAYILSFGGLLLLGARAGDLLGRRRTFLGGLLLFSLASLAGGLATAPWLLLAARTAQGVGAAFAAPSSLALLTSVFPEGPARVRAIALFTTVSAAGGAIGLVAGGLLTELVSWRWVMFVNVPIGLVVVVLGRLVLGETPRREGHFDLAGALSSTVGLAALVLGLVEAGSAGWGAPVTVVSLVAGVVLLSAFIAVESRAAEPILPLRLFAHAARSTANATRGLLYAGMYAVFFFLTQYLQDLCGYSPLRAGLAFLPMPISVFLSSQLVSRRLVGRLRAKSLMLGGISLSAVGLALATRLGASASFAQVLVILLLLGGGLGTSFVSLTSAALADVEPEDSGAASGLINVAQQVGAALGLAVLVTVFGALTGHVPLSSAAAPTNNVVRGFDETFGVAALFALSAFALVARFVPAAPRRAGQTEAVRGDEGDLGEELAAVGAAGELEA